MCTLFVPTSSYQNQINHPTVSEAPSVERHSAPTLSLLYRNSHPLTFSPSPSTPNHTPHPPQATPSHPPSLPTPNPATINCSNIYIHPKSLPVAAPSRARRNRRGRGSETASGWGSEQWGGSLGRGWEGVGREWGGGGGGIEWNGMEKMR